MSRADGYVARYAHLIDMSKPGCIAVNEQGRALRQRGVDKFRQRDPCRRSVPAQIITDAPVVKKYGFGMVFPGARNLKKLVKGGYVIEGASLRELAGQDRSESGGAGARAAARNQ